MTRSAGASPPCGDPRVEAELARLAASDLDSLRRRWRRLVGRPAPDHLSPTLLHRILAYRIQAAAFGDLDRETARMLDRLGHAGSRDDDADDDANEGGGAVAAADAIALPALPTRRPGTLLVREWQGELQQVMVLDQGFAWHGRTYDSLSKVARAITGTNWNGPRFFGLRQKMAVRARTQAPSLEGRVR